MLTSKLKSNESWLLPAKQKHFGLCLYSADGQLAASSLPPHPTPTCLTGPSPQHPIGWVMERSRAIPLPPWAFSTRKGCGITPFPKLSPTTLEKREITIGLCSLSRLVSQKRPSAELHFGSANSQIGDNIGPIPSPFVSDQVSFSNSSFPNAFPPLPDCPGTRKKGERERERKRDKGRAECKIEV